MHFHPAVREKHHDHDSSSLESLGQVGDVALGLGGCRDNLGGGLLRSSLTRTRDTTAHT